MWIHLHTACFTLLVTSTGHRLEFLLLLAARSLSVSFALIFQSRCFPGQLFSGTLLSLLQPEGKKRKKRPIYESQRGPRAKGDSFLVLTVQLCKNWRS